MRPTRTQMVLCWLALGLIAGMALPLVITDEKQPERPQDSLERTIYAIWMVESGGRLNPPPGDNGASRGPLQCGKAAWTEGCRWLGVEWDYDSCVDDTEKSCCVCAAYVVGWQTKLGYPATPETWARTWVAGPRGPEKPCSVPYWEKIQTVMRER